MKKLTKTVLFLFVASLSLTSCNKDDDNNEPTTSGNIVGKWEYYQAGVFEGGTEILDLYEHQSGCDKDGIEFKSNGTFVREEHDADCSVFPGSGTYTKSGTTLTTTYSVTEQYTETIKELSSSTLKVYETYTEDGDTYTDVSVYKKVN